MRQHPNTAEVMDILTPSPAMQQVYVKGNSIIVNIRYPYEITLDRLRNKEDLLMWVRHLSGKNWMTVDAMARFIDLAAQIRGLDIYMNKPKQKRLFDDKPGPGPDLSKYDYRGGPF